MSLITSPPIIIPATGGTKEILPWDLSSNGTFLVPPVQTQPVLQVTTSSSFGFIGFSSEYGP